MQATSEPHQNFSRFLPHWHSIHRDNTLHIHLLAPPPSVTIEPLRSDFCQLPNQTIKDDHSSIDQRHSRLRPHDETIEPLRPDREPGGLQSEMQNPLELALVHSHLRQPSGANGLTLPDSWRYPCHICKQAIDPVVQKRCPAPRLSGATWRLPLDWLSHLFLHCNTGPNSTAPTDCHVLPRGEKI